MELIQLCLNTFEEGHGEDIMVNDSSSRKLQRKNNVEPPFENRQKNLENTKNLYYLKEKPDMLFLDSATRFNPPQIGRASCRERV